MKSVSVTAVIAAAGLMLGGCLSVQPNPEFRACVNACNQRQDACMVNAGNAGDVTKCNGGFDGCVMSCERRYPRYLKP